MKQVRSESELDEAKIRLLELEEDPDFITKSAYRVITPKNDNNRMSFIDIHIAYLKSHPNVDAKYYISNLKLRLRKTPART